MKDFLSYPARVEQEDGGFTVLFRDLPNTFTYGETKAEAIMNAHEVLELMIEEMIKDDDDFNPPSEAEPGELYISVPAYLAFSFIIRQYRKSHDMNQTDVAKMLGITQQQAAKLEKPIKGRKLETISDTLEKFGYRVGFYKDENKVKAG